MRDCSGWTWQYDVNGCAPKRVEDASGEVLSPLSPRGMIAHQFGIAIVCNQSWRFMKQYATAVCSSSGHHFPGKLLEGHCLLEYFAMPRAFTLTAKRSMHVSAALASIDDLSVSAASAVGLLQDLSDDLDADNDVDSTEDIFHSLHTQVGEEEDAAALLHYSNGNADQRSIDDDDIPNPGGLSMPMPQDYQSSDQPEDAEFEAMIGRLRKNWKHLTQAQQIATEYGDDCDDLREQYKEAQRERHDRDVDLFLEDVALAVEERKAIGEHMRPGLNPEELLLQREDLNARLEAFKEESRERNRVCETQLRCFEKDDKMRAKEKSRLASLKAELLRVGDDLADWVGEKRQELKSEMVEKRLALGASTGY